MKSKTPETTQINEADLRFSKAIETRNYPLVTQLLNDNVIDPNEVLETKDRIYPHKTYKVFCYLIEEIYELGWSLPQIVRDKTQTRGGCPEKYTILHAAIALQNEALVDAILNCDKTNPNQKSVRGYTPLHYAAIVGNQNIIQKLIDKNANPTLTCNGFTPAELVAKKNTAIKSLLSSGLQEKPKWANLFTKTHAEATKDTESFLIPGESQFGILSKMRAMREEDEVIYANGLGVCSGVANIAMFYILSNNRDEQGNIISQMELEYILNQMSTSSIESFLEKVNSPEQTYLKLTLRAFTDGVELLQKINTRFELHRKEQPIDIQVANVAFPLLMTSELEELGGLSTAITHSSVFLQKNTVNQDELEIYFKHLHDTVAHLEFPIALLLSANIHAISVFYDPIIKHWILIDVNQQHPEKPIVTTEQSIEIAQWVYDALKFGHSGTQGNQPAKPFLLMQVAIYTAKHYEAQLKSYLTTLDNNEEFQALLDVTEFKATATDNHGYTWLNYAIYYGEVETTRRLHRLHAYEDRNSIIDIYYTEYMAKLREQFANYYQQNDNNKNYTYRYDLIMLASKLHKENKRLHYKFILEVLKNTPIEHTGLEDEASITRSILFCYTQWIYQGLDVDALFSDEELSAIIQPVITNHANFILNLNNIVKEDNELMLDIRQTIHELEQAPTDEESISFLSHCLLEASKLATNNALNNIPGGVLNQAITDVNLQFQQNYGEIANEQAYTALNSPVFFKPSATNKKDTDNCSEPATPHVSKK